MTENIESFQTYIPAAKRFQVCKCKHCPNVHVVLFNDLDIPFAQFTMAKNNLQHLLVECNTVLDVPQPPNHLKIIS